MKIMLPQLKSKLDRLSGGYDIVQGILSGRDIAQRDIVLGLSTLLEHTDGKYLR